MSDAQAVVLEGVEFRYPGGRLHLVVPDLRIARGEMTAIVGPNGSGKTTLLKLLCGLLRAERGRLEVRGVDPARTRRRDFARSVALVTPAVTLGFGYSALEVVLMGRAPHVEGFRLESDRDLAAAARAMRATDVLALGDQPYDTLSSGERQRVSVARALAQEPEILLLDEPAAFLDIKQQTVLYDLLAELNQRDGLTIVSVLHDLNLASLYFERVAMLREGHLHSVGTPAEVITYQSIREVFDTDVYVDINDLTGSMNVLPLSRRAGEMAKIKKGSGH